MAKIESAHNDTFRRYLSLTTSKGLKAEDLFLLSGEKLVREFLKAPYLPIVEEILTADLHPLTTGAIQEFSSDLFARIDTIGTNFNILVLEQPQMIDLDAATLKYYTPKGIEVAMPVGDPGNLGALVRSCEAFGVSRVIITQEAAHPFLPKAVKGSAGSVLRMPMARGPALGDFPDSCIALEKDGIPIGEFKWPDNAMLVVGEEGAGLGGKQFRNHISIPTKGVESLNAVVAASIALAFRSSRQTVK